MLRNPFWVSPSRARMRVSLQNKLLEESRRAQAFASVGLETYDEALVIHRERGCSGLVSESCRRTTCPRPHRRRPAPRPRLRGSESLWRVT